MFSLQNKPEPEGRLSFWRPVAHAARLQRPQRGPPPSGSLRGFCCSTGQQHPLTMGRRDSTRTGSLAFRSCLLWVLCSEPHRAP